VTATTGEHRVVTPRDPAIDRVCAEIVKVVEALRKVGGNRPQSNLGQRRS